MTAPLRRIRRSTSNASAGSGSATVRPGGPPRRRVNREMASGPFGTRWADIDEAPEIVEAEDEAFTTALSIWNARHALRPPEPDERAGQPWAPAPGTIRAQAIDLYDRAEEIEALFRSTLRGRIVWALAMAWARGRRAIGRFAMRADAPG